MKGLDQLLVKWSQQSKSWQVKGAQGGFCCNVCSVCLHAKMPWLTSMFQRMIGGTVSDMVVLQAQSCDHSLIIHVIMTCRMFRLETKPFADGSLMSTF